MEKKCVWGQNLPWNKSRRNKARINIQPKNHSSGGKQTVVCYAIWAWTPKGLWQSKGKKWPKCHLKYAKSKWRLSNKTRVLSLQDARLAMIRCASCNKNVVANGEKVYGMLLKRARHFVAKTPTFHHEDHGISLQRHWRFITKSTASHCKDNDDSRQRLRFFFWI